MAGQSVDGVTNSAVDYISLQDVLYSFNNSVGEEQAWAVCYQCAQYFLLNNSTDRFRDIYYYGTTAIRLSKDGDIKVEVNFSQGSGKGPPKKRSSFSLSREFKTVVTQEDAVQALGTAIYKALDYGLSASEEPHLGPELEDLIEFMTDDHPVDDEGDEGIDIERDSDDSQSREISVFQEIIDKCVQRLSNQQNAQLHYKAVCRALATEAKELVTFLDNIASGQQRLKEQNKDNPDGLDDLQRNDWARLWVQIMRDLRHGVRLKKVEQVHLAPTDFELTPFEILLEDIKTGRYKLNRIMVNGDIPPKVKSDAHAVILNFIRSRPPLKPVNKRVLKKAPTREMDPRELLLEEICKPHSLKPVRKGKVVGARKPRLDCDNDISTDDEDSPKPVRKVIKPVAAFQVSTDESDSYFSESDEEGRHHIHPPVMSPLSPVSPIEDPEITWKRAVAKDLFSQQNNSAHLNRRHTISACDVKNGKKVPVATQHATVLEEEKETAPQVESFVRGHASRKPTKTKLVSYRQKHGERMHVNEHEQNQSPVQFDESCPKSQLKHVGHSVISKSHGNLINDVSVRQKHTTNRCLHDSSSREMSRKLSRSVSSVSVPHPQRSVSPSNQCVRRVSRAESPVRHLSRSETFSCSVPRQSRNCVHAETHISARCDSPQTRQMMPADSFLPSRSESPHSSLRNESPCRHSIQIARENVVRDSACVSHSVSDSRIRRHTVQHMHGNNNNSAAHNSDSCTRTSARSTTTHIPVRRHASSVSTHESHFHSTHERCQSPCRKQTLITERSESPCRHGNRSRSQSPCRHKSSSSGSANTEPISKPSHSSLQESASVYVQQEIVGNTNSDSVPSQRQRPSIVRARSRPEIRQKSSSSLKDEEEKHFAIVEQLAKKKEISEGRNRPASVTDFRRPVGTRIARAVSARSRPERNVRTPVSDENHVNKEQEVPNKDSEKINSTESVKSESKWRRDIQLSRQPAVRTGPTDLRSSRLLTKSAAEDNGLKQVESRSRRPGVVFKDEVGPEQDSKNTDGIQKDVIGNGVARQAMQTSGDPTQNQMTSSEKELTPRRQMRPILRSRSEVRPRSTASKPVKVSHDLDIPDYENNNLENKKRLSSTEIRERDRIEKEMQKIDEIDSTMEGDIPDVIKTAHSQLKVMDLLHVSWKSECPRKESTNQSNHPCSDCRPLPWESYQLPAKIGVLEYWLTFQDLRREWHKWQNPIECLSLTLEEVTHIRMVLTKAELESLITDHELYTQVSKGKTCFTCKKTKFSLFGQWGTRCKFCQRNVCNYCLRKVNVPTEHFEKIPVYTLSPVPISPEVLEALKLYESTGSVPHSPSSTRKALEKKEEITPKEELSTPLSEDEKLTTKRRTLQRSHTIGVGMGSRPPPNRALLKGPQMSICCDCKSMIMEIIRASRTSVSLVSNKGKTDDKTGGQSASSRTESRQSGVAMRPRHLDLDDRPRPRSMLANFNFKSFNFSKMGSDT